MSLNPNFKFYPLYTCKTYKKIYIINNSDVRARWINIQKKNL